MGQGSSSYLANLINLKFVILRLLETLIYLKGTIAHMNDILWYIQAKLYFAGTKQQISLGWLMAYSQGWTVRGRRLTSLMKLCMATSKNECRVRCCEDFPYQAQS